MRHLMLFAIAWLLPARAAAASPEPFPMSQGTSWLYRGEVQWQEGLVARSAKIEWKVEIVRTIHRNDGAAALLQGFPDDLQWYEPGREPGGHLLLRIGQDRFYILHGPAVREALERLTDPAQSLADLVDDSALILQLPLREGARFGEEEQLQRQDGMYVWKVESEQSIRASGITGVPAGERTEYSVAFLTNADHTYMSFVPGIGITGYIYGHHGTVSDVSLALVEFRASPEGK
jgi:hypothetical protein